MANILGADLSSKTLKTNFSHPSDSSKVIHCLIDPCHALKLVRNSWSSMKVIYNCNNEKIDWAYIEKLVMLQESEGLHAGNKLKKKHLEWKQCPMKVNIAAQTLSSSVADAIDFCRGLKINGFENSKPTTEFIRFVDRWFDILNSRNPHGHGCKSPMRLSNFQDIQIFLDNIIAYISTLTWGQGQGLMIEHPKKTGFLGIVISSMSVKQIFKDVIIQNPGQFKYLLTYKLSQDHLELFYNAVRARGGWCVNPTAKHFSDAYKILIMHHCIKSSGGNVEALDQTSILHATRQPVIKYYDTIPNIDTLSISNNRRFEENEDLDDILSLLPNFDIDREKELQKDLLDIGLEMPPNYFVLSEFSENAIALTAGYVVRMVIIYFQYLKMIKYLNYNILGEKTNQMP